MNSLLEVRRLGKAFGAHRVLTSVSFSLTAGQVVGLLGPNGSGKSTLLNIMTGFLAADSGSVEFCGLPTSGLSPDVTARLGLVRTFQLPTLPTRMTVEECMLAACRSSIQPRLGNSAQVAEDRDRAEALLSDLSLADVRHARASALSGGQRKLLSVAMALQTRPRMLCLDEPTAGVHPNLRAAMIRVLRKHCANVTDIVVVEHDMRFVRDMCDRCLILDRGELIADCAPDDLAKNARVVEAYLGNSVARRKTSA